MSLVKKVDIDSLVEVLLKLRQRMKYVDIQISDENTLLLVKSEGQGKEEDTDGNKFNNSGLAG